MGKALGLSEGGAKFERTLSSKTISPYLSQNVRDEIDNPIKFIGFGGEHHGYDVTLLIDVCNAYLRAEKDGVIENDHPAVKQSHIILSASAKSGIKGLVYALANYDPTRQEIIDSYKLYVQEEAQEYAKRFPDKLYEAWYKIYQIPKPEKNKPWKFMQKHYFGLRVEPNGKSKAIGIGAATFYSTSNNNHNAAYGDIISKLHSVIDSILHCCIICLLIFDDGLYYSVLPTDYFYRHSPLKILIERLMGKVPQQLITVEEKIKIDGLPGEGIISKELTTQKMGSLMDQI